MKFRWRKKPNYTGRATVAWRLWPAIACPTLLFGAPFSLSLLGALLDGSAQGILFVVLFFLFGYLAVVPFSMLLHLAMKPDVFIDGENLVVIPSGGGATFFLPQLEFVKPIRDSELWRTPDGRYMLRFFPRYADFLPGGPTPSRMEIQLRSWNRQQWEPLYEHAPTHK